ncbi:MAG: BrnA antitoxin family protein [Burkholderiales bacterium]
MNGGGSVTGDGPGRRWSDSSGAKGKARLPGQRGPQKRPTKVAVTVRYSPEVVEYFNATGDGWQTRMNDALRDYVAHRRTT